MTTLALPSERARAARAGRALQGLTIAWNAAECVVALVAREGWDAWRGRTCCA